MSAVETDLGPLPPVAAEHVLRRIARAAGADPVPVRDAATVMLLRDARDGREGLEVLLQRRTGGLAFAGGMTAFPGGAVDPADGIDMPWDGGNPDDLAPRLFASPELARALLAAAVRETFEEVGVLVAVGGGADGPPADLDEWRGRLERRESTLADLLVRHGLRLSASALVPWSAWVTPEGEARRFDARFLACLLPEGQEVHSTTALASEADEAWWARPADALDLLDHGALAMLPPTRRTLEELSAWASAGEALAGARRREIRRYEPRFVVDNGTGTVRVIVRTDSTGPVVGP